MRKGIQMCYFDEEERPPLTPLPIVIKESLEITRLRAELADIKEQRDEARRMYCKEAWHSCRGSYSAKWFAEDLGWDCFEEKSDD